MKKLVLYNWNRIAIMEWSDFQIGKDSIAQHIDFETFISKSIFNARIAIHTSMGSLLNFQSDIVRLLNLNGSHAVFKSSDNILKIELRDDLAGHVFQSIELKTDDFNVLTINDYFDKTFLPELITDINNIIY